MLSDTISQKAARVRGGPPAAARRSCIVAGCIALIIMVMMLLRPLPAAAQAVRGEVTITTSGGYARLIFRLSEEVEAQVRLSGNVLAVFFKRPVDVAVDRIRAGAPDYIGAARRDPDGRAVRFALARKVRVHTIAASERFYVDMLPDGWTGETPGLPQEVVEELARRTREAERDARQRAELARLRTVRPVHVRVAKLPTFTRFIFELPELTGVTTDRSKDKFTLKFARPLRFDLADAKLASPDGVGSIDASLDLESSEVKFSFSGPVDVRSFREDLNFVVDVSAIDVKPAARSEADPARVAPASGPLTGVEAPQTVPAKPSTAPEVAAAAPAAPRAPPGRPTQPPSAGEAQQPAAEKPAAEQLAAEKPAAEKSDVEKPAAEKSAVAEKPARKIAANDAPAPPPAASLAPPASAASPAPPAERAAATPEKSRRETVKPAEAPPVVAELRRQGDNIRVLFPFGAPTPAAIFQRAQTLWLVFDTAAKLDIGALSSEPSHTIRSASVTRIGSAQVARLKLERPRLASVVAEGTAWALAVGDSVQEPTKALVIGRNIIGPSRTSVTIPFDEPRTAHRLDDPEIGDTLIVVTGLGPARGFVKSQKFVEFQALTSTHGVVIQPHADDLTATLATDKIEIGRPSGLTLSESPELGRRVSITRSVTFDQQLWDFDRGADFAERQIELITGAAGAPPAKRSASRLDLARFYLARNMFVEAKAVLDVAIQDDRPNAENPTALVLRSLANIMLDRVEPALKDLANPLVGNQHDAQLWRALAYVRQGKWAEARKHFRDIDGAMGTLPKELQRLALRDRLRAAIEVGDFAVGAALLNDLETIGVPPELEPQVAVLTGRLAEGLGRGGEAFAAYRSAVASTNRPAAAEGRLREIVLRHALGEASKAQSVNDLEMLTIAWRGDEIEIEALQLLAKLYTDDQRYRDAFQIMRTALAVHPGSDVTRRIQGEAAATFDQLFLAGRGDALPPIDALGLFYDFRDLTPVGRRGDEMIRRLADRLVAVDLLDPAAELLQHQVDNRLQGAARAQVATRLAIIYLLNHKPAKAQAALRATRTADLSNEIRSQRLLIESRALSDIGRHDLALEVIANLQGREAIRLRADIHWAAKRWQQAAEQIELFHGERWKNFDPLTDHERADILRAGIGYALADDILGMGRLREKYTAKMAGGPDQHAFEVVTAGLGAGSAEFREVARVVAAVDTLDGFLREVQARYPEMNVLPASTPGQPAAGQPTPPPKPDRESTGSIAPREVSRPVPSRAGLR
jgi:tetratricopeptide (TPR) repeat protein